MRKCYTTRRILTLRTWDPRGLRVSQQYVSRKPLAQQLSNAELLEIIHRDNGNTISTAITQTNSSDLDSQEHGSNVQTVSLLATRIPRLPLSPLTDPGLVAARTCHKAAKPRPSGDRSPFQLKLRNNPFGIHALISGTMHSANSGYSQCTGDTTSIMPLNRSSIAKLLPDSLWCGDTPNDRGTVASAKPLNPRNIGSWRRRDIERKSRRNPTTSSGAQCINNSKKPHTYVTKHALACLPPGPRVRLGPHTCSLRKTDAISVETGSQRQIGRNSLARRYGYLCPRNPSKKCINDTFVPRFKVGMLCCWVQEL